MLKTEREQRPVRPEEASLPWRAPGSGQNPMVAAPAGRDGGCRARAGGGAGRIRALRVGAAARVAGESGRGRPRRLAARRLRERVRAQKFYKWPPPSPMMKRALPPPSPPRPSKALRAPAPPPPRPPPQTGVTPRLTARDLAPRPGSSVLPEPGWDLLGLTAPEKVPPAGRRGALGPEKGAGGGGRSLQAGRGVQRTGGVGGGLSGDQPADD